MHGTPVGGSSNADHRDAGPRHDEGMKRTTDEYPARGVRARCNHGVRMIKLFSVTMLPSLVSQSKDIVYTGKL